ncbi:sodium:solute symporter [Sunxiuqinia rutila]|uniref:sodium:solute symporter n=1 Tax=Sunxiuqinia rutila TaxID=1397841 RepID=UPI003D369C4F
MDSYLALAIVLGYFILLMLVSWLTSRHVDQFTFFNANQSSPWYLVAYGMLGATLSGVTFISVPAEVGNSAFSYLQFVFGNLVGYWLVAFLLLPFYYRLKLISIYSFLEERMGSLSHQTASFFFLISKLIGAAFRLYLVAVVLQYAFFGAFGIPFWANVCITVFLIWIYTYRAGIKTIVWTDTLQTTFLVLAVLLTIFTISRLDIQDSTAGIFSRVYHSDMSQVFFWDWRSPNYFWKQFVAGIFMTLAINGMDQDLMQKNLTCKSKREAQKNMLVFSVLFVFIVMLFMSLGTMLYQFASHSGIDVSNAGDDLYPMLALNHLGGAVAIAFLLGITAASFSSADSALTSMTTAFSIDFLQMDQLKNNAKMKYRKWIHLGFSGLLVLVILIFHIINDENVVIALFKAASYTYGPILGLFVFAILFQRKVRDRLVPFIAVGAPVLTFLIARFSKQLFNGYEFGFELLILNGLLMLLGLVFSSEKK